MGVQTIDQNVFLRGTGKDQSVLLSEVNRAYRSFPIPRGKLFRKFVDFLVVNS